MALDTAKSVGSQRTAHNSDVKYYKFDNTQYIFCFVWNLYKTLENLVCVCVCMSTCTRTHACRHGQIKQFDFSGQHA